jgi:hypothetical protein
VLCDYYYKTKGINMSTVMNEFKEDIITDLRAAIQDAELFDMLYTKCGVLITGAMLVEGKIVLTT